MTQEHETNERTDAEDDARPVPEDFDDLTIVLDEDVRTQAPRPHHPTVVLPSAGPDASSYLVVEYGDDTEAPGGAVEFPTGMLDSDDAGDEPTEFALGLELSDDEDDRGVDTEATEPAESFDDLEEATEPAESFDDLEEATEPAESFADLYADADRPAEELDGDFEDVGVTECLDDVGYSSARSDARGYVDLEDTEPVVGEGLGVSERAGLDSFDDDGFDGEVTEEIYADEEATSFEDAFSPDEAGSGVSDVFVLLPESMGDDIPEFDLDGDVTELVSESDEAILLGREARHLGSDLDGDATELEGDVTEIVDDDDIAQLASRSPAGVAGPDAGRSADDFVDELGDEFDDEPVPVAAAQARTPILPILAAAAAIAIGAWYFLAPSASVGPVVTPPPVVVDTADPGATSETPVDVASVIEPSPAIDADAVIREQVFLALGLGFAQSSE